MQLHRSFPRWRLGVMQAMLAWSLIGGLPPGIQAQNLSEPLFFSSTTEDKLSLFEDRLGDSDMYGFGVESNALYYKANGSHRWYSQHNADGGNSALMTLTSSGKLGIGTATPNHELVVQGNDPAVQIRDDSTDNSANAARLELLERAGGQFDGGAFMWWNGQANQLRIGTKLAGVNTNVLVIDRGAANVGIGTSTPNANYRLSVNGKIRAKEIVVETSWADFVFQEGYHLRSLTDVERYIKAHGHLPDIPTASEVAAHGVTVGAMEAKLLQKVEELTLYLIDMKKDLDSLRTENATFKRELSPTIQ